MALGGHRRLQQGAPAAADPDRGRRPPAGAGPAVRGGGARGQLPGPRGGARGTRRADGFAFDVEALSLARRLGHGVAEAPVEWRNSPDSRVRPLLDVPRMFLELLAIRRRCRSEMPVPGESLAT